VFQNKEWGREATDWMGSQLVCSHYIVQQVITTYI